GLALASLAFVLWRLSGSIALALFLPLFPAVSYAAMTSQFPLLAAAIAGAGLLLLRDRPGWAGFLFGLLTLKLQLALLLPFCLWAGRGKKGVSCLPGDSVEPSARRTCLRWRRGIRGL